MTQDTRCISSIELQSYFVDKTTAEALAGGKVYFYKDLDRTVAKPVYQLTGSPPNYTYTALPNPLTLTGVGTFDDGSGNDIAVYYFPYEGTPSDGVSDAVVEQYYIAVYDSNLVPQFTREAWPALGVISSGGGGGTVVEGSILNQISNGQFVDISFNNDFAYTIAYTGAATTTVAIAPDWNIEIVHTGAGSTTVVRTAVAGDDLITTQPPYTLDITPGANITTLKLIQRLNHNPDIWSPISVGVGGYVAGSFVLGDGTSATMTYVPSTGSPTDILTAANATGGYRGYNATVELPVSDNTDTATDGYIDIKITLSNTVASKITSIQLVGLNENVSGIAYQQEAVNRQLDHLFHYYNPLLQYKPIPSFLVGWDFPLNPAQFLGDTVAASAIGANKSKYVWDQTIIFQSADSGVGITRASSGAMVTTAAAATQLAVIQYLDQTQARKILNSPLSVNVSAFSSDATGITATVSLWYTTGTSLPVVTTGTNNSIVATLDANGKPATFNLANGVTWTEVPRGLLGNAQFAIGTSATTNFNDYGFTGWDMEGIAACNTATFFAIVVGTEALTIGQTVTWNSISLVPGYIATRPAVQDAQSVLVQCRYYYLNSYPQGVAVGTAVRDGADYEIMTPIASGGSTNGYLKSFQIDLLNPMRSNAPTITFYSPFVGTAGDLSIFLRKDGVDLAGPNELTVLTYWSKAATSDDTLFYQCDNTSFIAITAADATAGNECFIRYQYEADARLGIV